MTSQNEDGIGRRSKAPKHAMPRLALGRVRLSFRNPPRCATHDNALVSRRPSPPRPRTLLDAAELESCMPAASAPSSATERARPHVKQLAMQLTPREKAALVAFMRQL